MPMTSTIDKNKRQNYTFSLKQQLKSGTTFKRKFSHRRYIALLLISTSID